MSYRWSAVLLAALVSSGGDSSDWTGSPSPSAGIIGFLCNPDAGCSFTFIVTSVSVRAGTVSGHNVAFPDDPVITTQVTKATVFQSPGDRCGPTDAMYSWQQLVAAGANGDPEDPLHTAFLVEMQRLLPIEAVHFEVDLDGSRDVVTAKPVSCSGR